MPQSDDFHVSVVVPCRNEIRHIGAFLDSLLRQQLDGIQMEILVADGMSVDGTRLVLKEFQKRCAAVRVIDNPEKIASTGLNRAIREARGEIIIRMDVHTRYAPDYVRTCIEVLHETGADNVGGPALTQAEGYWQQAIAFAFHTPFATGGAKFRNPQYEGPVDTVPYGCWRKSTLELAGLFDESQVRSQDNELNRRIVSHGGRIWQSPRIISWYQPRASLLELFLQYFQYGFWKVAVICKHCSRPSWRNFAPVSCLIGAIALLVCASATDFHGSVRWRDASLIALLALGAAYLGLSFVSAFSIAKRRGWKFLPGMPIVFATHHLSYAFGFVLGLLSPPAFSAHPSRARKIHTALSK